MANKIKEVLGTNKPDFVKVEDKNRFYYMLQQMQNNRWKITGIVLFLFFFIIKLSFKNFSSSIQFFIELILDYFK